MTGSTPGLAVRPGRGLDRDGATKRTSTRPDDDQEEVGGMNEPYVLFTQLTSLPAARPIQPRSRRRTASRVRTGGRCTIGRGPLGSPHPRHTFSVGLEQLALLVGQLDHGVVFVHGACGSLRRRGTGGRVSPQAYSARPLASCASRFPSAWQMFTSSLFPTLRRLARTFSAEWSLPVEPCFLHEMHVLLGPWSEFRKVLSHRCTSPCFLFSGKTSKRCTRY